MSALSYYWTVKWAYWTSESLLTKVEHSTQASVLEKQISNTLDSLRKLSTILLQSPSTSSSENSGIAPNVTTNLADNNHENRNFNLVICNLPETTEGGSEADKYLFKSLCSVLDLEIQSFTVTSIGKKIEGNLGFY